MYSSLRSRSSHGQVNVSPVVSSEPAVWSQVRDCWFQYGGNVAGPRHLHTVELTGTCSNYFSMKVAQVNSFSLKSFPTAIRTIFHSFRLISQLCGNSVLPTDCCRTFKTLCLLNWPITHFLKLVILLLFNVFIKTNFK